MTEGYAWWYFKEGGYKTVAHNFEEVRKDIWGSQALYEAKGHMASKFMINGIAGEVKVTFGGEIDGARTKSNEDNRENKGERLVE